MTRTRGQSCPTLRPDALLLLCPLTFPGKDTGVGCHASSRGSSPPRDWTYVSYVSCIGRQVLAPSGKPSRSLTRNQTWGPCTGSVESEPLDQHESPSTLSISLNAHKSRRLHSINAPILNWVRIPVLQLTVCVSLDKFLNSSAPRCSHP